MDTARSGRAAVARARPAGRSRRAGAATSAGWSQYSAAAAAPQRGAE
ncbi:hypothetical protein [Streptomyces sirii]